MKIEVDFTKPIRHKMYPTQYSNLKYLGECDNLLYSSIVQYTDGDGDILVSNFKPEVFENIPTSKWMNIYQGGGGEWRNSLDLANNLAYTKTRIALLEQTGDGELILHKV